jgi:hypothetical protein
MASSASTRCGSGWPPARADVFNHDPLFGKPRSGLGNQDPTTEVPMNDILVIAPGPDEVQPT